MLIVRIHNDGTGEQSDTADIGNYNYEVVVNYETIAKGRIEGHERQMGWEALIIRWATDLAKAMAKG